MSDLRTLETILEKFEETDGLFSHPLTLSKENRDVTCKYVASMLRLFPEEERERTVDSFSDRFGTNHQEMRELTDKTRSEENWIDYRLYTAFSLHCQEQLGLDNQEFFDKVAQQTFLDYSDRQIKLANILPGINWILAKMEKQFASWTNPDVVQINVERLKKGQTSFKIERVTTPQYRARMKEIVGEEVLTEILGRDCKQTETSFNTAFVELFRQPNLTVTTEESELHGERSVYVINPTKPYRSYLGNALEWVVDHLPLFGAHRLRKRNRELSEAEHDRKSTIRDMTDELTSKNAELYRKQQTIVKLLSQYSQAISVGERHGLRGEMMKKLETERNNVIGDVASRIYLTYKLVDDTGKDFLQKVCLPFGIIEDDLSDQSRIESQLYNVDLNQRDNEETTPLVELEDTDDDDFFSDFFSSTVYLDDAYRTMQEVKDDVKPQSLTTPDLHSFDPFRELYSVRSIREMIDKVNDRMQNMGNITLDKFHVSETIDDAVEEIKRRPDGSRINVTYDVTRFNAEFESNKVGIVHTMRDFLTNALDANSDNVSITCRRPAQEKELPYMNELNMREGEYPAAYICIEDDGDGIPQEQISVLHQYLCGKSDNKEGISTKTGGKERGLGTQNLRTILEIHNGSAFYEQRDDGITGTRVHVYLLKLSP